mgnify:CR=1 FL=1
MYKEGIHFMDYRTILQEENDAVRERLDLSMERVAAMGEDDIRCVYLMDRDGSPKHVSGYEELDMSIYADWFAVLAMAGYAAAAKDKESYDFGKKLYLSIVDRVEKGKFHTLPYPLSSQYRAHGIPMIFIT